MRAQVTKKPPLLFLHGWGGSKDSFLFLTDQFTDRDLWFISFAGHGNSPPPEKPMSVTDFANEVFGFVEQNNIHRPDVVAHSFGGRIALVLFATNPEKFGRLLITGGAGLKPKRKIKTRLKIAKFKLDKWLVKLKLKDKNCLVGRGSADYNKLSPIMRETFKKVVNENLACYAKKVQAETLLVWGQNDTETPLFMGKKMNRYIKNSVLVVFNGKSHFCFYEEPLRFALVLKNFFV